MSLFEIKKVFREKRPNNISHENNCSMRGTLLSLGLDQLETNLEHMLGKEAGIGLNGRTNFQHNPVDYLGEVH